MLKSALYKSLFSALALIACIGNLSAQSSKAFKVGEQLKYQIHYGFIRGGEAILTIRESVLEGKKVNNLYLNAVTVGLASVLYQVNDTYQSFTDIDTNWPYKSIRDIKENSYKHYSTQTFDHWSRTDSSVCNSSITGNIVVVKGCQDILSSVYYLRSMMVNRKPLPNEQFIVHTYFTDEKYPLIIRFKGYEKIKTKYGTIECQKYMPEVITGRVFQSKDDMAVWFSNDNNFIPIRVKLEIYIGAVYCDLIDYKGLLYPIVFK
jgi:hypothetical protein